MHHITAGQDEKHEYACLMVDISDGLKEKILKWNFSSITDTDLYTEEGHGRELKPHVTLKYGLLDEDPEIFFKEIPGKPIPFTLGPITRFTTDPQYDVLKVDVISPELAALNKKISDKFRNEDSHPVYKPHLTLAYVKKGAAPQLDGNDAFAGSEDQFITVLFTNCNNDMYKKHLDAPKTALHSQYKTLYCRRPIHIALSVRDRAAGD